MNGIVSVDGIKSYMQSQLNVEVFDVVSSTNSIAKDRAKAGEKNIVIVAREQTEGRGRFSRKFYSPKDAGVYFSLIIQPVCEEELHYITPMCAIASAEAIRLLCGKDALIKWVNDIYIDMKKCVGILCEGVSTDAKRINRIVCGIGVNLYEKDGGADEEIKNIAGFVGNDADANRLVAAICDNLVNLHSNFDKNYIALQYKNLSMLQGKTVTVVKSYEEKNAEVEDIDNRCRLVVRYEDGKIEALDSGEVRVKL